MLRPAAPDAPGSEVVRVGEPLVHYAVRDGIFSVWARRRWQTQEEGMEDIDGLIEQALRLARETGLGQI